MSQSRIGTKLIRWLVVFALLGAVFSLVGFDAPITEDLQLEPGESQPMTPSLTAGTGYPGIINY